MTLNDVFTQVDELKPNQYDDNIKLIWLNDLEGKIAKEILEVNEFKPYTLDDYETELLVEEPYTNLYRLYLMLMIDYTNAEFTRYAQSLAMYNTAMQEYQNYVTRHYHTKENYLKLF